MQRHKRIFWALAMGAALTGFGTKMARSETAKPNPPPLPENLQVPDGNVLIAHFFAVGVQIYTCQPSPTDPTQYIWVFKAPEAVLYRKLRHKIAGIHYAGPTWEYHDGSKVVGTVLQRGTSPDPDAIPWLLLQAKSHEGDGLLSQISYIQRLNTAGGKAPMEGCDAAHVGVEVRVHYTAEYFFYAPAD